MKTWLDEPAICQHLWTCAIQISTFDAAEVKLHWVTIFNREETFKKGKSNFSPSLCLTLGIFNHICPLLLGFWLPRVTLGIGMLMGTVRYAGFCEVHGCDSGRTDGTTAKADAINKRVAENGEGQWDHRCFKSTRMVEPLCCPPVIITTLLISCSPV